MTEIEAIKNLSFLSNYCELVFSDKNKHKSIESIKMAINALEKQQQTVDLKAIFTELEKKSFSVDFGQTESMAVRLVDIEDMLINQFK